MMGDKFNDIIYNGAFSIIHHIIMEQRLQTGVDVMSARTAEFHGFIFILFTL